MRCGIYAVGGDVDFEDEIAFHVVIILGKHANLSIVGKNDNSLV
ncbi:hypothetical protein SDC9_69685 [bioreactor metagenome]|uniref:Uncharacterized protein n=1 Tax=bioreactor metagenome TaxID=1076179 RepID=A0A644Y409_9ZZZZ